MRTATVTLLSIGGTVQRSACPKNRRTSNLQCDRMASSSNSCSSKADEPVSWSNRSHQYRKQAGKGHMIPQIVFISEKESMSATRLGKGTVAMHHNLKATETTKSPEFPSLNKYQPTEESKKDDYYANMGDAIRTLREDIPQMFRKDLNYSIYREDIVFKDSKLEFRGKKNYKIIFWSLRFHGQLFFKHMHVDILRIWQPDDYIIKMRWQVIGSPRVWWEAEGHIDGISTYKIDKEGKIYEHSVDNVQLRDPPITNPLLYGLNYVLSPSGQPQSLPMPGS